MGNGQCPSDTTRSINRLSMSSNKISSTEIVHDLLRLISKPLFKRQQHEIDLVLPWLRKRSQLLQNQEQGVLQDIVRNCSLLSVHKDDVIIKQGEKGDSFYIILRGSVSVYIDPKMTGEGGDDSLSRTSAKKKKKTPKKPPNAPESEASILSGMTKPSSARTDVAEGSQAADDSHTEEDGDAEDDRMKQKKKPSKASSPIDRNKFGKFIVAYNMGGAFGELALVHRDSFRNASVITDEETDLMVIDQDLFDRSLRAEQEAKYDEIRRFIDEHPFFNQMNIKFKKLLEMSLRKETYIFDTNIIKQGDPVIGLHFIISGGASVSIQPKKHQHQYPHLWPFEAGIDQLSIEFEHLREARRAAILRKYEDPSVWETKPEELVIRREQGYAAIEKKMKENHINLCTVQAREVLGDVETLLNLNTYLQTVRCSANTTCFVLDTKNFERVVSKRNNPQTMDVMREYVIAKLHTRMNMRNADLIPFLGYLHQKLTEQLLPPVKKVEPFRTSKTVPNVDEEMQHLLQYFKEGKEVVLIKPSVPGVVYYRELMHEKMRARENQRKSARSGDSIKLGSVTKTQPRRKPRSMLQIRESLRAMMEAEVIELETKRQKKKIPRIKSYPETKINRVAQPEQTPRTLVSDININDYEVNNTDVCKNNTSANINAHGTVSLNDHVLQSEENPELPKPSPPVFVTELSKAPIDSGLPAIREENSQDEINLRPDTQRPKSEVFNNEMTLNTTKKPTPRKKKRTPKNDKHNEENLTPLPPIDTSRSPRPISTDHAQQVDLVDNIPSVPTEQCKDSLTITGGTEGWNTAMTFVNQRVQERLTKSLLYEDDPMHRDYETSEPSLQLLENRIKAFHVKYGMGNKTKNLPNLKRYKLDLSEDSKPRPGGKVWVKKQMCKFKDSEYMVKDHKHVRYRMVESIPEFEKVQNSKIVMQQILQNMSPNGV